MLCELVKWCCWSFGLLVKARAGNSQVLCSHQTKVFEGIRDMCFCASEKSWISEYSMQPMHPKYCWYWWFYKEVQSCLIELNHFFTLWMFVWAIFMKFYRAVAFLLLLSKNLIWHMLYICSWLWHLFFSSTSFSPYSTTFFPSNVFHFLKISILFADKSIALPKKTVGAVML